MRLRYYYFFSINMSRVLRGGGGKKKLLKEYSIGPTILGPFVDILRVHGVCCESNFCPSFVARVS